MQEGPIMAKITIGNITTLPQNGTKQQRKKLAKREAKLMLQIGQVNKDCHRIEQKIARAQAKLEATRTNLQDLEGELANVRTLLGEPAQASTETTQPQAEGAEAEFAAVAPDQNGADAGADVENMVEIMHLEAAPPVEGRADVGEATEAAEGADADASAEDVVEVIHLKAATPAEGRADVGEATEAAESTEEAVESVLTSEASKGAEEDTPPAIVEPTASSVDLEAAAESADSEATTHAGENGEETDGSVEGEAKSPTTKPRTRRRTSSRRQTQSTSDEG
jgi:hypothetical protein